MWMYRSSHLKVKAGKGKKAQIDGQKGVLTGVSTVGQFSSECVRYLGNR